MPFDISLLKLEPKHYLKCEPNHNSGSYDVKIITNNLYLTWVVWYGIQNWYKLLIILLLLLLFAIIQHTNIL